MFIKIKSLFAKINHFFSNERCYSNKEKEGIATFGYCCGEMDGDGTTNYLNYNCIGCRHFEK